MGHLENPLSYSRATAHGFAISNRGGTWDTQENPLSESRATAHGFAISNRGGTMGHPFKTLLCSAKRHSY